MQKFFANLKYFFFHRTTRYGVNLALVACFSLAIAAALGYLSYTHRKRIDFTSKRLFSLSEQSRKVLGELPSPVQFMYFYQASTGFEEARKVFDMYRHSSPLISYELHDLNSSPTLARTMGITNFDTVVLQFANGDKKKSVKVIGATEEKITNGLMRLLKNQEQTIYFLAGHGEASFGNPENADSLSYLKGLIENEVYTVKPLQLELQNPKIPDDATALVIAGPRSEFLAGELRTIQNWVQHGGKLMLLLNLDFVQGGLPPGAKQWATWLEKYGVRTGTHMLVDSSSSQVKMKAQILIGSADSPNHVISKDFPRSSYAAMQVVDFYFPLAARLQGADPMPEGIQLDSLVKTTPSAWEVNDWQSVKSGRVSYNEGKDFRGVMSLGYALESKRKDENFRAVVFSTAAFVGNGFLLTKQNKDIFLNSLAWLANQESFISIRQKEAADTTIQMNPNIVNLVIVFLMFVVPLMILGTGIWIWYRRRGQ